MCRGATVVQDHERRAQGHNANERADQMTTAETAGKNEIDSLDALRFMLNAWEEAIEEGVDRDMLANAALFTALTELVSTYGEQAVSMLAKGLPQRILSGEFSEMTEARIQ
jgi:hypothetical protein